MIKKSPADNDLIVRWIRRIRVTAFFWLLRLFVNNWSIDSNCILALYKSTSQFTTLLGQK